MIWIWHKADKYNTDWCKFYEENIHRLDKRPGKFLQFLVLRINFLASSARLNSTQVVAFPSVQSWGSPRTCFSLFTKAGWWVFVYVEISSLNDLPAILSWVSWALCCRPWYKDAGTRPAASFLPGWWQTCWEELSMMRPVVLSSSRAKYLPSTLVVTEERQRRNTVRFILFVPWAKQNPLARTPPVRVWSTVMDSVRTLPTQVCISWPMTLCNAADHVACISSGVAVQLIHHNPVAAYTTRCADIVDASTHRLDGRGTTMVLKGYKSQANSS